MGGSQFWLSLSWCRRGSPIIKLQDLKDSFCVDENKKILLKNKKGLINLG